MIRNCPLDRLDRSGNDAGTLLIWYAGSRYALFRSEVRLPLRSRLRSLPIMRIAPLAPDLNEQRTWLRSFQGAHKMRSPVVNGGFADMSPWLARCIGKAKMNHVPTSRSIMTKTVITGIRISRSVAA